MGKKEIISVTIGWHTIVFRTNKPVYGLNSYMLLYYHYGGTGNNNRS